MASNRQITGFNLYKDKLNRNVHYDFVTKKGYIIKPSDENQYYIYSKRFLFPIIVFALLFNILDYAGSILASIVIAIITEVFYRTKFLKRLHSIKDFTPVRQNDYFDRLAKNATKQDLMIRTFLYFALGILLIAFGIVSEFEQLEWMICFAVSLFSIAMGLVNLLAISRKK